MRTVQLFISALLILALCTACKSDDDAQTNSTGVITHIDLRECACCGGYWITISNDQYRFLLESLPPNDLDLANRELPVTVDISWRLLGENESCGHMQELIEVFSISEN